RAEGQARSGRGTGRTQATGLRSEEIGAPGIRPLRGRTDGAGNRTLTCLSRSQRVRLGSASRRRCKAALAPIAPFLLGSRNRRGPHQGAGDWACLWSSLGLLGLSRLSQGVNQAGIAPVRLAGTLPSYAVTFVATTKQGGKP